jgi:hypothetical protein
MKPVSWGEAGAALIQRRRGLSGAGLLPVPENVDRVLHCLAWQVGISFSADRLSDKGVPAGTHAHTQAKTPA